MRQQSNVLTETVKEFIDKSVLCWLATCTKDCRPNVSPKEMFTYVDDSTIIIANIASPHSVRNIKENPQVCVSFVEVFIQKGFKVHGQATIVDKLNPEFDTYKEKLTELFSDRFRIRSIIKVVVERVSEIKAPSYVFFPDTTEEEKIREALRTYDVSPCVRTDNAQ